MSALVVLPAWRGYSERDIRHLVWVAHRAFLVWGNLDDCLEQIAEWCEENAPGLLTSFDIIQERYTDALLELYGADNPNVIEDDDGNDERAWQKAEEGMILLDRGRCLDASEVSARVNPSRAEILHAKEYALAVAFY